MTLKLRQHGTNRFLLLATQVAKVRHVQQLTFRADFIRVRGGKTISEGAEVITAEQFATWWTSIRKVRWHIVEVLM